MTTIVVVIKNGRATLGADSLATYGSIKEPSSLFRSEEKLIKCGATFIAIAGTATFKQALIEILRGQAMPDLDSVAAVFRFVNTSLGSLKEDYHLQTITDQGSPELVDMDLLLLGTGGAFCVFSNRTVHEVAKYYAFGSGADIALGALHALYDGALDSEGLCRAALDAASTFDTQTGGPYTIETLSVRR